MKITAIKSATVIIEHEGYRLLCDPWLEDGVYFGSWCHYPPLEKDALDNILSENIHGIYISHIHPDHCSIKSLSRFPADIPIYIHRYGFDELKRLLHDNGFTNVIELSHGEAKKIATDFFIEIYAADNCDPEKCGKLFGCQYLGDLGGSMQIDTMAVIYTAKDNHVIVNTNDCQYGLAKEAISRIKKEHSHVDVLLTGYVSASSYPQCFENLSVAEKLSEKERIRQRFLSKAAYFAKDLEPEVVIPFAGEYVLGGRLWELNHFLSPPPKEDVSYLLEKVFIENGLYCQSQRRYFVCPLFTGGSYDLSPQNRDPVIQRDLSRYTQIKRFQYIEKHLANRKYDYELRECTGDDTKELLQQSVQQVHKVQERLKIPHKGRIIAIEPLGEDPYLIEIDNPGSKVERATSTFISGTGVLKISLDKRLLQMLLYKAEGATWNHAEIGSHLSFFRPTNHYDRTLFYLLNFLHL